MRVHIAAALVSIAAISAACGGGNTSNPVDPAYQPEVVNDPNAFSFQLTGLANGDGTLSYTWQNDGTVAKVNRSSSISAGTVTIRLRDASNTEVLLETLNVNGDVFSAAGTPGSWTIVVDFAQTSGTINFRADRQ